MKILCFSDVHCSEPLSTQLVERSRDADVVIGAGDFGTMRKGIERSVDILSAITVPAILVPGNGESVEELVDACLDWQSATVLHGEGTEVDGVDFFGIGGGIPKTPFGAWSWDFTEQQAQMLLAGCPRGGVLVTHSPPHGIADANSAGEHLGSHSVLAAVKRTKPRLVVCGHIHDSWNSVEKIDDTVVINAGPEGVEFELN